MKCFQFDFELVKFVIKLELSFINSRAHFKINQPNPTPNRFSFLVFFT